MIPMEDEAPEMPAIGDVIVPSMLVSKSVNGPWNQTAGAPWPGASLFGCNNPAAWMFPNGTTLLICKVWKGIRQMQVSIAPKWSGPYRVVHLTDVFGEDP